MFLVTSDFLDGLPFNVTESSLDGAENNVTESGDIFNGPQPYRVWNLQDYNNDHTPFVKFEDKECVETYTAPIIFANSDLLLVSSDLHATNSLLGWFEGADSQLIEDASFQLTRGEDLDMTNKGGTFCLLSVTSCDDTGSCH